MIPTLMETDKSHLPELIENAIHHVLSSMCFAEPAFAGAATVPGAIASKVVFSGDVTGTLRIAMEENLARQLAADFLAIDAASLAPEQANLFVLELTNVLCGEMLTSTAPSLRYEVSLPSNETASVCEIYPYCFTVREGGPDLGVSFDIAAIGSQ